MVTKSAMTNAVARKFFLHDADQYHGDTYSVDSPYCCYFSYWRPLGEMPDESRWGFWVRPCGTVDVDSVSANGKLPSAGIVAACVRAAVQYLRHRTAVRYPKHRHG
jgi:hypothetical protein